LADNSLAVVARSSRGSWDGGVDGGGEFDTFYALTEWGLKPEQEE